MLCSCVSSHFSWSRVKLWNRKRENFNRKWGLWFQGVKSVLMALLDGYFCSKTTLALISMKRTPESMRLPSNSTEESWYGGHNHPSWMGHWAIILFLALSHPIALGMLNAKRSEKRNYDSYVNYWAILQNICQYWSQALVPLSQQAPQEWGGTGFSSFPSSTFTHSVNSSY